jgi:hypothetical protein
MFRSGPPTDESEAAGQRGIDLIRQGLALIAGEDRSEWSGSLRAAVVEELSEVCERAEAERIRAVGEWDADTSWAADGALSAPSWLAAHTRVSKAKAARLVRTARLARRYDRVGVALASGALSSAHAEVLATATRGREVLVQRDESVLVDIAPTLSVDDFTTAMQHWRAAADDEMAREDAQLAFAERAVSHATTLFGRVDVRMSFDADGGATVIGALQAYDPGPDRSPEDGGPADGPRTLQQRHADAMVQLCAEALARRQASGHPTPGIDGMIDVALLDSVGSGNGADLADTSRVETHMLPWDPARRCELDAVGPVARDVLIRRACDAAVGRIVLRGRSEVLDVGRRTRIVPRALRRAIERRDRGCAFPGCTASVRWCDVHHLVHWADGGTTDLDNCVLLCRRHHLLCHEGGWRIARSPEGPVEIVERGPDPCHPPPRPHHARRSGHARRRSLAERRGPPYDLAA